MAVDLRVNLGGLELKNPLVIASGDIGCHLGQVKEAERCGAAAFITKGCIPRVGAAGLGRKPRFRVDLKRGVLSAIGGFRRLGLDDAKRLISESKKEVSIPVGANIFVFSPSEEEKNTVTLAAKELYEVGADLIELDTTGNLPHHFGETEDAGKRGEFGGEYFTDRIAAAYPGFVYETIRSVKSVVKVPVMGKVAYQNLNVPALIESMEKAAVDIIDIGNSDIGLSPGSLDIYHPHAMSGGLASIDGGAGVRFGLSGEPLRGIAQAHIIRSAKSLRTPILGCGGIMNWRHVVEAIMCGATATASCTVFMLHGFEALRKMEAGLTKFMGEQGYSSLADFRGIFGSKFKLTTDYEVHDAVARVDPEKCNGCGLCAKPAQCGLEQRAISLENKKAVVDESECSGCETCASICPRGAVSMIVQR